MRSIFFGAAFLADEKIDSYMWLFQNFLQAMGGKAPAYIVTDEDASMRAAIASVLPNTIHRLCMWHIMKKLLEKIDAHLLNNDEFRKMINSCVWGSETIEEFESRWQYWITTYHLENNEWLTGRYHIRESWIPAYFREIWLGGILRTTSRSESANSFFNLFIGRKLALVEFWIRFDTALKSLLLKRRLNVV
jgi:transposase-like protein